jgi:hypothetical protein
MIYLKFLWSLLRHKWFVILAGQYTKVPLWRLLIHDLSKFSPSEFAVYARNFFGDYSQSPNDREKVSLDFTYAWLHHENNNPHHWGYWIPRSGKSANEPLPMPEVYVREMIADCMGASKAYTGSWDIAVWLNENGRKWSLHDETVRLIAVVMCELNYFITDNCDWSWMAPLGVK